ncbi:hypothetical protein BKA70DRAFT_1438178 [Coprinopsis sp. MPI-PUGE-AT-0042]|nr:hypothetical protein BKA70DRAFT_1438178 [Coprinopsis sp. MPI-PUGE-AT-0042]
MKHLQACKPEVAHYLRRIQAAQVKTEHSTPVILHWASPFSNLSRWGWPADPETGERIPPSELESHRRTHYFYAPCCLCALDWDEFYVESRIGIVQVPSGSHGSFMNGEYVAECALRRCGYFVPLERFYSLKLLRVVGSKKRRNVLPAEQVALITDFDPKLDDELGLYQALPKDSVISRGSRQRLAVAEPITRAKFIQLWSKGLEEHEFWKLFVQCSLCRTVMPKEVFVTTHGLGISCDSGSSGLNDEEGYASSSGDTELIDDESHEILD